MNVLEYSISIHCEGGGGRNATSYLFAIDNVYAINNIEEE